MRLSLLQHLLELITYNQWCRELNVGFFEIGSIYVREEKNIQPDEKMRLSIAISGKWLEHEWQNEAKKIDFFVMKGIADALFSYVDIEVDLVQTELFIIHPIT